MRSLEVKEASVQCCRHVRMLEIASKFRDFGNFKSVEHRRIRLSANLTSSGTDSALAELWCANAPCNGVEAIRLPPRPSKSTFPGFNCLPSSPSLSESMKETSKLLVMKIENSEIRIDSPEFLRNSSAKNSSTSVGKKKGRNVLKKT